MGTTFALFGAGCQAAASRTANPTGTRKLGVCLAEQGIATVTNVEQCKSAVDSMRTKFGKKCKWECGDCTAMTYANGTYDYVIDKAVLDAMLCAEGGTLASQKYLAEVARVLKPKGKFLCVSTAKGDSRTSCLEQHFASSEIQIEPIAKPSTAPVEDTSAPKHYV